MDASVEAIRANLGHIARFEAKLPPAQLPNTAVTEAFGAWAYPKIVSGLQSDNTVIKAKSIIAARELLVAPEKHIQCIAAGITPALRNLLTPPNDPPAAADIASIQASAASTLQLLVSKEVGCRDALQHGCLPPLLQLLKQPNTAVRDAAYGCLSAAAIFEPWRVALVQEGALPYLLRYAQQEEPQRAVLALDLLHHCAQARHNEDALTQLVAVQQAVPVLAGMMTSSPAPVCLGAIRLLGVLASTRTDGRLQAVECGCVPQLLELLQRGSHRQMAAAAGALMMLTLSKEGKVAMHQARGLPVCLTVLQAQMEKAEALDDALTSHVLQAVTNAAEYGPCGVELQRAPGLQVIQGLATLRNKPLVQTAAVQALHMAGVKDVHTSSSSEGAHVTATAP